MKNALSNEKRFAIIEKEWRLFDRKYLGFPYWQQIRFFVFESMSTNLHESKKSIRKHETILMKILRFLKYIPVVLEDARNQKKIKRSDAIIIRYGRVADRFFDCWHMPEGCAVTNIRLTSIISEMKHADLYMSVPMVLAALRCVVGRLFFRKNDVFEDEFLSKLERHLRGEFGQSISMKEMKRVILLCKWKYGVYRKYYERLFDIAKPKAVVFVCYYTNELYPAIQVANERGIKTIELQHGVVGKHASYWFEDQRGIHNAVPDYFLMFGNIHQSWIKLLNKTHAVDIGYPWQEKMLQSLEDVKTDEKTIVVYPFPMTEFELIMDDFINSMSLQGYRVLIKVHPSEVIGFDIFYPILSQNPNAEIIRSQKEGIYYWLKLGKYHVMANTTVGMEAMLFSHTAVYICEAVPHDQNQFLIDSGMADGFVTSEELEMKIKENHTIDKRKHCQLIDQLWKPNAVNNMNHFFSEMLGEP